MAENSEIARRAFSKPHFGHAIDLSAADHARRASNFASHSWHTYSYNGILVNLGCLDLRDHSTSV